METRLPFEVVYDTPNPVPLADIIASLSGTQALAEEIGPILQALVPGLTVQALTVSVVELSQRSPLREAFAFGLIAVFQDKLAADMPKVIHDLFGLEIPHGYNNIAAIIFIILLFYSADHIFFFTRERLPLPKAKRQLQELTVELAGLLGMTEENVVKALDDRYNKSRSRVIFEAAQRVLAPSKNQANALLRINEREIPSDVVAEFPSGARALEAEEAPSTIPLPNTEIFLHAQDVDHSKQGWAAVVPELSEKRIRMHLYPPMNPADIYTKEKIRGDLLVEQRRNEKGEVEPIRVHLLRLSPEPTGPSASSHPVQAPPPPPEEK